MFSSRYSRIYYIYWHEHLIADPDAWLLAVSPRGDWYYFPMVPFGRAPMGNQPFGARFPKAAHPTHVSGEQFDDAV